MGHADGIEWRLIDTDLTTVLGILPQGSSRLYLELNEPGSGELKIPLDTKAAQLVTSQMFCEAYYRGMARGGFFVENLAVVDADGSENAGRWMSVSGRGALAMLEDGIVWTDGTNATKREFDSATKADILITLIEEAKARGCYPNMIYDFTAAQDSVGNYWTDSQPLNFNVGVSLLEVVRDLAKTGIDFEMLLSGGSFLLRAYRDGKGSDKSGSIYFRTGVNCEEVSRQELGGGIKNALLVRYEDGYTRVIDSPSITARRRREKLLEADYAGNSSVASTFGRAEIELTKDPQQSISVRTYDGAGPRVFADYIQGDTITLDRFGAETSYRVRGLQMDWNGQKYASMTVDLNSTIMENELKMAKDIRDLQDRWASAHDAGELDMTFWAAIAEATDASIIYAFAISGSLVYVGGIFAQIGNVAANNIAVYNIESNSWNALGSGLDDTCYDIQVIGSNVYACGEFLNAGGVAANHVAVWNGSAWAAMGSGLTSNYPYSMAALGTDLLVAGNLTTGTGWVLKKWNGSAWSTLGAEVDGKVLVVEVNGSDVYIGGEFIKSGLTWLYGVAKLNGSAWEPLGTGAHGIVRAIAFIGSNVYIGGDFTLASSGPGDYLAVWDGSDWYELGNGVNGAVNALAASTVDLFVGGDFTLASGVPVNYVAKYNGESWEALTVGLNASCYALKVYNLIDLYVGGSFTLAGGTAAKCCAAYLTTFDSIMDYMENASGYKHPNHSGHVHSVGDGATTIQPNVVANTMLADMDASTLKGRPQGAGTGDPVDLSPTQVRLLLNVEDGAEVNNISDADAAALTGGGETALHSHAGVGGGTWGSITGTLSSQTDLQNALNAKLNAVLAVVNRILYTNGSGAVGGSDDIQWDDTNKCIWIGGAPVFTGAAGIGVIGGDGTLASRFRSIMYKNTLTAAGGLTTARAGGTKASPTKVTSGMMVGQWTVLGTYDTSGAFASPNAAIYAYADADWSSTSRPVRWEIYVTPSGSATATLAVTIGADGTVTLGTGDVNIPSGKTYNINGSPHTHTPSEIGVREKLSSDRTYYVRTNGNDSNNGLANTAGGAFLTIQRAINVICSSIDTGGYTVTIQVADGTYTGSVDVATSWTGGGKIVLQGNMTTPANVYLNTASGILISAPLPATITIQGFKIASSAGNCISMTAPGTVNYGTIEFSTASNAHITSSSPGSFLSCISDYSISGGATNHWVFSRGAACILNSKTVTLTGTPAFTVFANCQMVSVLRLATVTFSGSASAGTKKYDVSTNGVVYTSGGVTLPGGVAGTTATGGQYV